MIRWDLAQGKWGCAQKTLWVRATTRAGRQEARVHAMGSSINDRSEKSQFLARDTSMT
jgi:hypothetical protein